MTDLTEAQKQELIRNMEQLYYHKILVHGLEMTLENCEIRYDMLTDSHPLTPDEKVMWLWLFEFLQRHGRA